MKYQRIHGGIRSSFELTDYLSEHEILDMMRCLFSDLSKRMKGWREECELEDGRKQWMVSYPKYIRVKAEKERLLKENAKLRDTVRKLTS